MKTPKTIKGRESLPNIHDLVREIYDYAAAKAVVALYQKRDEAVKQILEKMTRPLTKKKPNKIKR